MTDIPDADRDERLAQLLEQLSVDQRRGARPNIDDAATQHPDLAEELRQLWAAVQVAEAFGRPRQCTPQPPTEAYVSKTIPPVPGAQAPALPRRFGDYELLEELGRGGMGIVYKARQVSLDRIVALKVLKHGDRSTDMDLQRFRNEAEAAARLNHPNIVPVYEVGEAEGQLYFTMRFIEGITLSRLLTDHPLPAREAARIVSIVSRAIHYAHQNNVLHRDLKPANILLRVEGANHAQEASSAELSSLSTPHPPPATIPFVMDFGLAKRVQGGASLTATGAILGTPSYMPPEQASGGRGKIGPASDVYSLGAILYELLTGRPPFQAASSVDTLLLVLDQEPVEPRRLNPQVDKGLELICLKCLQKQPDLRYASAAVLADDLDKFLAGDRPSVWSGSFLDVVGNMFRDTHHAPVLENWGVLWMWHSLKILLLCGVTNLMLWQGFRSHLPYLLLWSIGLCAWGGIFWTLRRRGGPVLFIERQIAHVWAAGVIASIGVFIVEWLLSPNIEVLGLSPVLAIFAGMIFVVKAGMLSGEFYIAASALFLTAVPMALFPQFAPLIFGIVSGACFFIPGLIYHRRRKRREAIP